MLVWALNKQVSELQACPPENKEKLCKIISRIKTVTNGLKLNPQDSFMENYKQLLSHLGMICQQNLDHQELTDQLLNFVKNSITVLGAESLQIVLKVSIVCCQTLPYARLEDILNMISVSVE